MVKQKFIQFFDVNTTPDSYSVFKVKAGGEVVHQRLAPFFQAYKYYKLGKVTVKCVPASTLPVDPTGLSYEAGENTVDPRDQFNPGLVRITNGEEVFTATDMDRNMYYATMLDPRWYKFRLQSGFSRSAVPLVWNIAENGQHMYPTSRIMDGFDGQIKDWQYVENSSSTKASNSQRCYVKASLPEISGQEAYMQTTFSGTSNVNPSVGATFDTTVDEGKMYVDVEGGGSGSLPSDYMIEVTPITSAGEPITYPIQSGRVKLGWMPTDCGSVNELYTDLSGRHFPGVKTQRGYAFIPEVDLITFVFPQAFKTKYYYRIFVETTVYFKDAVVIDPLISEELPVIPIDRFARPSRIQGVDYPNTEEV